MTSNYDRTKMKAAEIFLACDTEKVIESLGLDCDEEYIYLRFVAARYRIDRRSGACQRERDGQFTDAGFNDAMTIYDILSRCEQPVRLSGEYALMQSLSTVQNAYSYAGKGAFANTEKFFEHRCDELDEACRALGGTEKGKGDVSYEIPVFGGIKMIVSFWDSDDEFPPSLKLYADRDVLSYMHYETLWYMASFLLSELKAKMGGA